MNVLLINPPNCGRSIPEEHYGIKSIKMIFRGEPLSLETLAGNLNGHAVVIADLKADPVALTAEKLPFAPDVVGITGVTCEANTMLAIAEEMKTRFGAWVVVGGHHASCDPSFFSQPYVDYVVTGLGKLSFRQLIDALDAEKEVDIDGILNIRGQELSALPVETIQEIGAVGSAAVVDFSAFQIHGRISVAVIYRNS